MTVANQRIGLLFDFIFFSEGDSPPLSIQQPLVLCDLHLETGLNVQQHFVLVALLLDLCAQAHQLLL